MINYSPAAESARAYLLRRYNPFDIYVEDSSAQNVYVRIMNRILNGHAEVTHVYPLGSKINVVNRCMADQGDTTRKRLYIIDGDLDLILGLQKPPLSELHRLPCYCVENSLLSMSAIAEIAMECRVSEKRTQVMQLLDCTTFLESACSILGGLFVIYAVYNQLGLSEQTVSYPIARFLDVQNDPHSLSERLVRLRAAFLLKDVVRQGRQPDYRRIRDEVVQHVSGSQLQARDFVSGKSCLLPLVHLLLAKVVGFNDKQDRLKVRLAAYYDPSQNTELSYVVQQLAA